MALVVNRLINLRCYLDLEIESVKQMLQFLLVVRAASKLRQCARSNTGSISRSETYHRTNATSGINTLPYV